MNTPRALPARNAGHGRTLSRSRPDLMWLLWALFPPELSCAALSSALGVWALIVAAVFVVAVVVAVSWSVGGRS